MARYDQLDLLLPLLRDALPFCAPFGRLRTVASVRAELTLLLNLIEEIDDAVLRQRLRPMRSPLGDIFVPFEQAASGHAARLALLPQPGVDALGLAWPHAHLSYQSHAKQKHDHQHESQQGLDCAEGCLDNQFAPLKALVFEKLEAMVQTSSLVALVHAFIRPSLNSSKGPITQETVNLIMFYHNHRRYKSGKRQGKAPIALLTGATGETDWGELGIQPTQEACQRTSLASSPPLELGSLPHAHPTPSQALPGQALGEPSMQSDISWSPMDAEAASIASSGLTSDIMKGTPPERVHYAFISGYLRVKHALFTTFAVSGQEPIFLLLFCGELLPCRFFLWWKRLDRCGRRPLETRIVIER